MEEYLKRILDNDLSITHGVYEPPNNIPILRYKVNKLGYKVIVIGSDDNRLSCIRWLSTELIKPTYIFDNIDELEKIDTNNKYFVILSDEKYKYSAYQSKIITKFSKLGISDYICPYDYEKIPKHDTAYLKYFKDNYKNLIDMLKTLKDEESKRVYVEYIRSKMFCDFYRLKQNPTWEKYFDNSIYTHLNDEVFVNCGSSNGDTLFYYLEKYNEFKKIIAIEGDSDRIRQFNDNMMYLDDETCKKIKNLYSSLDNNENKLDSLLIGENVSLINMDIEGMELEVLKGAKEIIKNFKPVIAACAYHLPTDLYELPMYLKNLVNDYQIFYRKYASTVRNRFCNAELVMYAVPKNRLTNSYQLHL